MRSWKMWLVVVAVVLCVSQSGTASAQTIVDAHAGVTGTVDGNQYEINASPSANIGACQGTYWVRFDIKVYVRLGLEWDEEPWYSSVLWGQDTGNGQERTAYAPMEGVNPVKSGFKVLAYVEPPNWYEYRPTAESEVKMVLRVDTYLDLMGIPWFNLDTEEDTYTCNFVEN